jgi:hypothetical protein
MGGFLGDVAVGGAGAGDRLQPHAGADPGDEVGHGLVLARARGLGADGPAALVLGRVQRFGQRRGQAQAVDAEARVDPAGLEREEGAELVGPVGGPGEADLQHLAFAIDARQLQPHAFARRVLARELVAQHGGKPVETRKDVILQPERLRQAEPHGEMAGAAAGVIGSGSTPSAWSRRRTRSAPKRRARPARGMPRTSPMRRDQGAPALRRSPV